MNNKYSDEQIDKVLSHLMAETVVDEALIDEISTSPTTWWAVKRNIARENAVQPWPPSTFWKRIFSFGVPAFAALALVTGVIWFTADREGPSLAANEARTTVPTVAADPPTVAEADDPKMRPEQREPVSEIRTASVKTERGPRATSPVKRPQPAQPSTLAAKDETVSTEFIALSHAGGPESGQVVRVKVPSSMMVSLGVVPSVSKPSSLVDAEVVVGDDGQTHAIRFIRQDTDGVLK
jgi:hypothetical protein